MTARRAAIDVLIAILDQGRALDDALASAPTYAGLVGRDRGFARAIVSATLRRLGGIDAVIAHFLARPLPANANVARALLRTGAAQLLVLATPPHAAVGETVALAKLHAAPFAGLINAVLRRIGGEGAALFARQPPGADLPAWLFTRWRAAFGDADAQAIALALRDEPPFDITPRGAADEIAALLDGEVLPTGGVRLASPPRGGDGVEAAPGFADGAWWVQDAAAALPARLLGDVDGRDVLDLCAAPGGKTLQLAAMGARVTALDSAPERLALVAENLARARLLAELVCADARTWKPDRLFDAVLLDAPCTATGTLRRHPDIAWLRRPSDIQALAGLQRALLSAAANMVKPGGALVYAVCSLEPEEGPEHAAPAGFARDPIDAAALGDPTFATADGALRTSPAQWATRGGLDGFYAVRFRNNRSLA